MSVGATPRIKPWTSLSPVKRSTNWASPTTVEKAKTNVFYNAVYRSPSKQHRKFSSELLRKVWWDQRENLPEWTVPGKNPNPPGPRRTCHDFVSRRVPEGTYRITKEKGTPWRSWTRRGPLEAGMAQPKMWRSQTRKMSCLRFLSLRKPARKS